MSVSERLSMPMFPEREQHAPLWSHWRALGYFCLYRLFISGLLVALLWLAGFPKSTATHALELYTWVACTYFLCALVAVCHTHVRWPGFNAQVLAQTLVDASCLCLLTYSYSGLDSGFGMLLVVVVAGGSILTTWKMAIFIAALTSIGVLGGELYLGFTRPEVQPDYVHAGFLGATFFICAVIGQALAARVKRSEALVTQHVETVKNLSQLNDYIVQRMLFGILVLDVQDRIRQCNRAAGEMLHIVDDKEKVLGMRLSTVCAPVQRHLEAWREHDKGPDSLVYIAESGQELRLSFVAPHISPSCEVLIFMEDATEFKQHTQQIKLASLGRLTASIAHEVRNPLGAISNAGQLLLESETLGEEEGQLAGIVLEHAHRVNRVIENVLSISRREPGTEEQIELGEWLRGFVGELREARNLSEQDVRVETQGGPLRVSIDVTQLHQVAWNLAENALRYSHRQPRLLFRCGSLGRDARPWLDIQDRGCGIPARITENLFEPFVTTEQEGTGLGLYIARELCEANRANLVLHRNSGDGCCFRINFGLPATSQRLVS